MNNTYAKEDDFHNGGVDWGHVQNYIYLIFMWLV